MSEIPAALRWIQYITPLKYCINLVMIYEFDDGKPEDVEFLISNDVHKSDEYIYWLVIIALFTFFRIVSCLILKNNSKKFLWFFMF